MTDAFSISVIVLILAILGVQLYSIFDKSQSGTTSAKAGEIYPRCPLCKPCRIAGPQPCQPCQKPGCPPCAPCPGNKGPTCC